MSVVQGFSESWTTAEVTAWAHAHPTVPRVIGIDVGQDKLTVWFGAPNPDARATAATNMRWIYFSWVLCRCSSTATNKQACDVVTRALDMYKNNPFALASDIVVEKQHKKNGRMKALAAAIRRWIRAEVPGAERMRVVERQSMSKFANVVQLPCPMPHEYKERKDAAERVIAGQVTQWAGKRWYDFYNGHPTCRDDLADAALIAQDYAIVVYPMAVISAEALEQVHRVLADRRARNTWRKKKRHTAVYETEFDRDFRDDDDDNEFQATYAPVEHQDRARRRLEDKAVTDDFSNGAIAGVPLYAQLGARLMK